MTEKTQCAAMRPDKTQCTNEGTILLRGNVPEHLRAQLGQDFVEIWVCATCFAGDGEMQVTTSLSVPKPTGYITPTCCICGDERACPNIIAVTKKSPTPGEGWGCMECGLKLDGAIAVLCDPCMTACKKTETKIKYVCIGNAASLGRVPFDSLTDEHRHNMFIHNRNLN